MNPKAMEPHGRALMAYFNGDAEAAVLIRLEGGDERQVGAGVFFRSLEEFTTIEKTALQACRGHVLDTGAGTGSHSLVLQSWRNPVTAIDVNPDAVEIMSQRGVKDVKCIDIFDLEGERFDTLLVLGHGIGMVETLDGLSRFLQHAPGLINPGGQILLDSMDVSKTDDPVNLAYHQTLRDAGRYIGEARIQFEFRGETGPYCGWLHVDPYTLDEIALENGWTCSILHTEENGDYLAQLQME